MLNALGFHTTPEFPMAPAFGLYCSAWRRMWPLRDLALYQLFPQVGLHAKLGHPG
jgi:hypothetical protein